MKRSRTQIATYLDALKEHDHEVAEEIGAALDAVRPPIAEATDAIDERLDDMEMESIVLRFGRPVLDVRQGDTVLDITEVESLVWISRLTEANNKLVPNIPAVGRIEMTNHPKSNWLGTGWLVRDDVVVTNRHVAEVFARSDETGFHFRPGLDGRPITANVDFLEEFDNVRAHEFPVFRVLHIESDGGPDLAFLRIEPIGAEKIPDPVVLSASPVQLDELVAVIGYPARDPFFPDQDLMNRIFRGRFDKKRLAPGLITGIKTSIIHHDCSTLGGNSGGEVVSLKTGQAVALHFAGTLFAKNHAIPAEIVGNRLADSLAGRANARRRRPLAVQDANMAHRGHSEVLQSSSRRRTLTASIPIHIQVQIGDVASDTSNLSFVSRSQPAANIAEDDDEPVESVEARVEDYADRMGYQRDFLGEDFDVPLPVVIRDEDDSLTFVVDGETREVLDYQHFSVLMSRKRRLCRYSACNIDGATSKKRKRKSWRIDPRILKGEQIEKECYGNPPKFSRGHMTRREDPVWGSEVDASTGNADSMHLTNAVPQIQPFNAGMWLSLEDYALDHTREDEMRITVFTGPFLHRADPVRFGVQIPLTFWKVIVFVHDETGDLSATGYMMSQKAFIGPTEFVFGQHENRQVAIADIAERAGLSFGSLTDVDPFDRIEEAVPSVLTHPSQIRFVR